MYLMGSAILYHMPSFKVELIILFIFIFLIFYYYKSLFIQYRKIWPRILSEVRINDFFTEILATVMGAIATYYLATFTNAIIASSIIGLLGAYLWSKKAIFVFCGSFVGMSSMIIFPWWGIVLSSIVAGVIISLGKDLFEGTGGKLGYSAFIGTFLLGTLTNTTPQIAISITLIDKLIMITLSTLIAYLTFTVQVKWKQSPVISSAIVGLILGLVASSLQSTFILVLSAVLFGATFVGMSSIDRLPKAYLVVLSGIVYGIIAVSFYEVFNGLGGKLGMMAFISVLITDSIRVVGFQYKRKKTIASVD